jgi:hypothetical protein
MRLSKETACMSGRGQGQVYVGPKLVRAAPWDWTGYTSLDVLVLSDPDWSLFKPQQVKAICEWVSNGGSVLLVLGKHPLPQDSPLRAAMPFHIGEPRQVEIPSQALLDWGLASNWLETVRAWPLLPKQRAAAAGQIKPGTASLCGSGHIGFGRIAVLAFEPAQLSDAQAEHAAAFWTSQIVGCVGNGSGPPAGVGPSDPRVAFYMSGRGRTIVLNSDDSQVNPAGGSNRYDTRHRIGIAQTASNQVMNHLFELRQMQPLSIWWVILTLMALAVLLGPVDYLILKRLDRQPYTWLRLDRDLHRGRLLRRAVAPRRLDGASGRHGPGWGRRQQLRLGDLLCRPVRPAQRRLPAREPGSEPVVVGHCPDAG